MVGANQNTETVLVKDNGMRFEEEVSDVRIRLDNLIKRSKELTSIRLEKDKPLSDNVIKNLVELQDTITGAFAEITDMLAVGSDESEEVYSEMSDLWAETNQVLAETADPDL